MEKNKSKFIPNSFQVPNSIVDDFLLTLNEFEIKCYLFIVRKTKGWQKESDSISISQFQIVFGAKDARTIKKALKGLLKKDLITQKEIPGYPSIFSVNLSPNPHDNEGGHSDVPPTSTCTPCTAMRGEGVHGDEGGGGTSTCTPHKPALKPFFKPPLSSAQENQEKRESFQTFRKRIIAQYAGHEIAQQPPGYLPNAVLSISSSGYLRINGKDCTGEDAIKIWEWLFSFPHVIGAITPQYANTGVESFIGREFYTPEEGPYGLVAVRKKIIKIEKIEKNQLSIFFEDEFEKQGKIRQLFSPDELEKFLNEYKVAG